MELNIKIKISKRTNKLWEKEEQLKTKDQKAWRRKFCNERGRNLEE